MAKKNPKVENKTEVVNADAITELKQKWLKLAPHEKLGKTKSITKRLDDLQNEIKELENNDTN